MNTEASPIAPLLMTDAYKIDHRRQYPEGTEYVYSNYTNRGSRIPGVDSVVHFGLQAFLQDFCIDAFKPFFAADVEYVAELYTAAINSILGPNEVGTDHIRALHARGYLPLRFCAVPEGTLVPLRVPSFTIENTDPEFFWLTNFVETVVSAAVWHPSTVATIAHQYRVLLEKAAKDTGGDAGAVDFQLHDFSYRGQVGSEAAAISALGHLLSFKGSDTLLAYDYANRFYSDSIYRLVDQNINNDPRDFYPRPNGLVLASVAATEHSVMCAGGMEDEFGTYNRLLDIYPSGIVSIVSDTWDLWNVITDILPKLKDKIMARDGKVVVRPDSGDPVDILCGTMMLPPSWTDAHPDADWKEEWKRRSLNHVGYDNLTPSQKGVIELLWDEFGGTVNEEGYKVLDSHIGAIYGDSITLDRAKEIVKRLEMKGFASTNVVFGVGSYSYQYVTRDTFGSAMKATWVQINGEGKAIQKFPATDSGLKKSATGRLAVLRDNEGDLYLIEQASPELEAISMLQPVWENGEFLKYQSLEDVRAVLASQREVDIEAEYRFDKN